jgi:DNA-directed RNA polymerase specialized sigma24 family protein
MSSNCDEPGQGSMVYEVMQVTCLDECRAEERRRGHRVAEEYDEEGYVTTEKPEVKADFKRETQEQVKEEEREAQSEIKNEADVKQEDVKPKPKIKGIVKIERERKE